MAKPSAEQINEYAMQVGEIWESIADLRPSDITPERRKALEALKDAAQRLQRGFSSLGL